MYQKLLNPFKFTRLEVYPGIEVRKDTAVNVGASFKIDFSIWKKTMLNKTIIKLSHMDYRDLRRIKSLYGVSNGSPVESSAVEIVNSLVTDIGVIIRNLTAVRNQFELLSHIKSNVTCLPDNVLRVIKHINACNLTTHITGTEASLLNFTSLKIEFTDTNIGSEHSHQPEFTLGKINKLNESISILGIENLVTFNGLADLFGESDDLLNINVQSINKNDILFNISKDHVAGDLLHGILCMPQFTLSDISILEFQDVTITNGQINDILQVPMEMLTDPTINHVSTKKLVNDYINSKIPTRLGEEPIQKGLKKFKGFDDAYNQSEIKPRPTKKSKVQKALDRLEGDMSSEVEEKPDIRE